MDELDELLAKAAAREVRLVTPSDATATVTADAVLFDAVQLPIVALTTLACLSSASPRKIPVSKIGLRVGAALMVAFPQFESVGRRLQWSLRVRAATANAIAFLEASELAAVQEHDRGRTLVITAQGRDFLARARGDSADAGRLVDSLRNAAARTRTEELRLL